MRPIEFVARVAELIGSGTNEDAELQVRAVFTTLAEAVNTGEMMDIAEESGTSMQDLGPRPSCFHDGQRGGFCAPRARRRHVARRLLTRGSGTGSSASRPVSRQLVSVRGRANSVGAEPAPNVRGAGPATPWLP